MNWIKSTDRLPEQLPEHAGRKRIKCLVGYQTQCGWQWKSICRYKEHGEWNWGEHLKPDYWCIPENPYLTELDETGRTGVIPGGMTLNDLYLTESVAATAVFVIRERSGKVAEHCTWDRGNPDFNERIVEKYRLSDYDPACEKYNAVEVWLA